MWPSLILFMPRGTYAVHRDFPVSSVSCFVPRLSSCILSFCFQPCPSRWSLVFLFLFSGFCCPSHCYVVVAVLVLFSWMSHHLPPTPLHLFTLSSSSSVLTRSCHWIWRIPRRHLLWNTSTALSPFIFNVSQPYSRAVFYKASALVSLKTFFEWGRILFLNWQMHFQDFHADSLFTNCSSQVNELIYFYSVSSYPVV